MFKIERERTFWWPVKVQVPIDGGQHEARQFRVKLRQRSLAYMFEKMQAASRFTKPEEQIAAFQDFIVDWDELQDEAGQPLPCSAESLRVLLEIPTAAQGLIEAIREAYLPPAALERRRGN